MQTQLSKRIISSIILLPILLYIIIKGSYFFTFLLIICFAISVYEWYLMAKQKTYFFFGIIFLFFSFYCIYKLRNNINDDYFILIFITSICILSDIGGYIFGKILRGPKLTVYSPNKTYAGVLGSYIMALSSIPILIFKNLITEQILINTILFVIIVCTVSQIGDIFVSYFKRRSKIKDSGKIIPGHGGLLDRIDGMIFAFPFAYMLMFLSYFNKF